MDSFDKMETVWVCILGFLGLGLAGTIAWCMGRIHLVFTSGVGGRVKTSSAKAKGRRACSEVKEILLDAAGSLLEPDDIVITSSGDTGEDLKLSPRARKLFPACFEVKCQESLSFWAAIKQAESHIKDATHQPILAFKRNNTKLRAIVSLDYLAQLMVRARENA